MPVGSLGILLQPNERGAKILEVCMHAWAARSHTLTACMTECRRTHPQLSPACAVREPKLRRQLVGMTVVGLSVPHQHRAAILCDEKVLVKQRPHCPLFHPRSYPFAGH